uniref:DALR anticodon binding domain containing 3 n=1 Tax=Cairina moschata TaxID=8855 RepID=A0A8C3CNB6_CAIMO
METAEGRPAVAATLRALSAALGGGPAGLWVKESSARNLRHRDFLAPRAALRAAFSGGQVPPDVIAGVTSASGPGALAVRGCQQTGAGLAVQLRRPEAFCRLLGPPPATEPPPAAEPGQEAVVLHCPALRRPAALAPRHLRPVLLADHLAQLLRAQGVGAQLVPAVSDQGSLEVLRQLRVEWPSGSAAGPDAVSALKQALSRCPYAAACEPGAASLPEDVVCKVHLKSFVEQQGLAGYDPNLDVLLVTEGKLRSLAELQHAVLQCTVSDPAVLPGSRSPDVPSCHVAAIVHVVSCEEEFQQQQMDLLWRILDPGAHTASQVRNFTPSSLWPRVGAGEAPWFPAPRPAVQSPPEVSCRGCSERCLTPPSCPADEAWTEVIETLTVAAIRFELLSTAHRSQASSISTKGTKSGAFVMYNCARLATLFDTYQRAVEQGTYPPLPPASTLNFSCLREEGEWLLLFNYLLPFPEVLQQAAQLPAPSKGLRITANTEAVCKFLIQLSMDFSSYYNRVHILGEPFPHLFDQMFARLQLLGAVRDVFHRALATLHLPPLSQI